MQRILDDMHKRGCVMEKFGIQPILCNGRRLIPYFQTSEMNYESLGLDFLLMA